MATVTDAFKNAWQEERPAISFEMFPPKGNMTLQEASEIAGSLRALSPDFISVTYSAAGSNNKDATIEIASMLNEIGLVSVAHLACIGMTSDEYQASVDSLKSHGIENVLGLRGDLPENGKERNGTCAYDFAYQLIKDLSEEGFCVGGAAYPEGHIACLDRKLDIERLKQKQDSGAEFLITQLFYDNDLYYRFKEDTDNAGITIPISCGIMPFLGKSQIQRMVFMCGASLPSSIIKLLARYEDDQESLRKAGIEYACKQLCDLKDHGVDGLHVYAMNQPDIAYAAVSALGCVA